MSVGVTWIETSAASLEWSAKFMNRSLEARPLGFGGVGFPTSDAADQGSPEV
jgi:hypothetical protein